MSDIVISEFPPRAKAITPHNTNPLTDHDGIPTAQHVFVGTAGDVSVIPSGNPDGSTAIVFAVPAGGYVPVVVKIVKTATTAGGLVGVW